MPARYQSAVLAPQTLTRPNPLRQAGIRHAADAEHNAWVRQFSGATLGRLAADR
jgi:hypothetical protein